MRSVDPGGDGSCGKDLRIRVSPERGDGLQRRGVKPNRVRPELPPDLLAGLFLRVPALERAQSVADVRRLARARTPLMAFDFVDGGADDEVTMRANRAAFERVTFAPRALTEVAGRSLE